ncbi:hypothetical protein T484DRAFT_1747317 [Baffinella frigidus]|nr:hypothetical protein T484DRAFT_1747317 [Cryptophyta sp. CCMP2293]
MVFGSGYTSSPDATPSPPPALTIKAGPRRPALGLSGVRPKGQGLLDLKSRLAQRSPGPHPLQPKAGLFRGAPTPPGSRPALDGGSFASQIVQNGSQTSPVSPESRGLAQLAQLSAASALGSSSSKQDAHHQRKHSPPPTPQLFVQLKRDREDDIDLHAAQDRGYRRCSPGSARSMLDAAGCNAVPACSNLSP